MNRLFALTLVLLLLLTGCGSKNSYHDDQDPQATQTQPTQATTEAPTEAPTEPPVVYFDPLNGEILDAPYTGRIYATTVANERESLPHVNAQKADILFEMYVNGSKVRCMALFSDASDVDAVGSTRSTRLMINKIAKHYDAILSHAGGSSTCLKDATEKGIPHYNVDSLMRQGNELMQGTAYRDKDHPKIKFGDANLYAIPSGVFAYAESEGVQTSGMPEKDYGLRFTEDGTPADGMDAETIQINLVYGRSQKDTTMVYDAETDRYAYYQYGGVLTTDLFTEEAETFQNVIIMNSNITHVSASGTVYHTTDFTEGGTGYFANGGKLIPIIWACDGDDQPFRFMTLDAQPLLLGQGNTYIAVCSYDSVVTVDGAVLGAEEVTEEPAGEAVG